jgi:signal transduction histidine kinase
VSLRRRYLTWSRQKPLAADAVIAGLVGAVVVPLSAWPGDPVPVGLTVVVVTALAWRRTLPVASVLVVYSATLIHLLLGWALVPSDVLVVWSLWSVTLHGPRWAARVALAGAGLGSLLVGAMGGISLLDMLAISTASGLIFLTTWSFASARRAQTLAFESLADKAGRQEREQDQRVQLGVASERARIAREMHDIVAHSLSVIVAQADGGRYAAADDPEAAVRALGTIAETGRAALTDMRRLLGVLRTDPQEPNEQVVAPGPVPTVADITSLVEQLRSGGMRVSFVRVGDPRALPPGAGLTLFRIAQESLTNVLKHAGPDPEVTLVLQWFPARVVLQVSDDGRGAASNADGLGQGVLGMCERAAMFGGEVSAGPRPGGGFQVYATLPAPGPTQPEELA